MKIKQYLTKHGVKLAVIVVVLALIVIIGANVRGGTASFVRDADGSIKTPVQKASTAILDWFEGVYGYLYQYDMLVEENNALRAQVTELQEQAKDYEELSAENERLRQLNELRDKHEDYVFESSKIVAWDTSNYVSAFTISKGESSGIELGDCVITEYGALVGQVIELGTSWATVRTLIDVDTNVGALAGDNSYAGLLSGEFALMKKGCARMGYLASGAQIFTDDQVFTSGKGGSFPAGLMIGTVTTVMTEAGGQTTYGIIEPACDLDTLSQVFIIKEFDIVE